MSYIKKIFAQYKDPILRNLKINFTEKKKPKKLYCSHPFLRAKNFDFKPRKPKLKKRKAFFFKKNSSVQNQTKKKLLFFLFFKIAFKPNKGQESQVPSQHHHD